MPKYRVHGNVNVSIDLLVEASSEEKAIETAYVKWPGLTNYVGNGKVGGAMIGPRQDETDANIDGDGEPEFTMAELEGGDVRNR